MRHLRTQGLWVQEVRLSGRLSYKNVLGSKNPANVLTKHVPAELLQRHLETSGIVVSGGRAETAPELNSLESWVVTVASAGADEDTCRKKVRFSSKIVFRAIPHANQGRSCWGLARKEFQGRRTVAGGAGVLSRFWQQCRIVVFELFALVRTFAVV